MAEQNPVVYLFHGDDEPAMREAVSLLQSKLGDPVTAEMNTSRFEGQNYSFDDLNRAARAAPFLAARRLIVAGGASKVFAAVEPRSRFSQLLDELSPDTALVLLEDVDLSDKKQVESWKKNWLLKWATSAGSRALVKEFPLPQGAQMATWLIERTKSKGGEMQQPAANALAQLVDRNKQIGDLEIEKLLAYVGYTRAIEAKDVAAICQSYGDQGDFFGLIDGLSAGNGSRAFQQLQSLMQERDLILLYFSLVGHFRTLIQVRDLVDRDQGVSAISKELNIRSTFRVEKLVAQAKRFRMSAFEAIYRRLLELDEQVKTGEMEPELAMEMLVAGLSVQPA